MDLTKENITILGGGIAGLAVARALARHGANLTLLEQAPAFQDVGAGIQITPNGARVLDALGLGEPLRDLGLRSEAVELRDYKGARVLRMPLDGADYFLMHRADLITLLADSIRGLGVQTRLSQHIEEVNISEDRTRLIHDQGQTQDVSVLIGADGVQSKTRMAVNGRSVPFFTRQVAWRALVPAKDDEVAQATVWMGPGRHVVTYPIRNGRLINIVAVEERGKWADEGWQHQDNPGNLRAAFHDFAPDVQEILARIDSVHLWGLFRHPISDRWYNNKTVILGDAAHPTLPFLAQGANLALEDAWVLANFLKKHPDYQTALSSYQAARIPRVNKIIDASNRNAKNYHLRWPLLRFIAHNTLRLTNFYPKFFIKRFDWIYNYSAN